MHEYITSAQSVERWIFLRIRSSTSTLFRDATYIWEHSFVSDTILHPRPPFHHDPFYLETSNAYCISLSVIMLDHKRLVHRHHRVKFIGNWVTTYPDDYRRIVLFWRRIDWTRCEKHHARYIKNFLFFLNFILENFIFLCFLGKIDLWNVRRMYIVFFNFMMVF